MTKSVRNSGVVLFFVALVGALVFVSTAYAASTNNLMPTSDGNYTQWTPSTGTSHFALVDETPCNGTTDYNSTTVVGNRDSYGVSLSSVPDGSTITAIAIKPCASRAASGGAAPVMNVFYRANGVNSADSGSYSLSGTTPTELATTTYSGLSIVKSSTTTLEIGAVLTSSTKGARLSRISTILTYTPAPPNAPSNLVATASTTEPAAKLTWTDNSSDENNFQILRSLDGSAFSHRATTSANTISYIDTGLASSTTYYYQVRAYSSSGGYSAVSNTSSTTSGVMPTGASNLLLVSSTTALRIDASWTDNSDNELNFRLEFSTTSPSSGFQLVGNFLANTTSATYTPTASGTVYYFRLLTGNGYGTTTSSVSSTTSATLPPAPTSLSLSTTTGTGTTTTIILNWNDNSSNELGFKIERKKNAGSYSQIATTSASAVSHNDLDLTTGTYTYRVRAFNSVGNSAFTNEASSTVP